MYLPWYLHTYVPRCVGTSQLWQKYEKVKAEKELFCVQARNIETQEIEKEE